MTICGVACANSVMYLICLLLAIQLRFSPYSDINNISIKKARQSKGEDSANMSIPLAESTNFYKKLIKNSLYTNFIRKH